MSTQSRPIGITGMPRESTSNARTLHPNRILAAQTYPPTWREASQSGIGKSGTTHQIEAEILRRGTRLKRAYKDVTHERRRRTTGDGTRGSTSPSKAKGRDGIPPSDVTYMVPCPAEVVALVTVMNSHEDISPHACSCSYPSPLMRSRSLDKTSVCLETHPNELLQCSHGSTQVVS